MPGFLKRFPRLRPGQRPDAADYNRLAEAVEQAAHVDAGGGLLATKGPFGTLIDDPRPQRIRARLTSRMGSAYGWQRVVSRTPGAWEDDPAFFGTTARLPAYELENSAAVALGSRVELTLAEGGTHYVFPCGCSAGQSAASVASAGSGSGAGGGGGSTVDTLCCSGVSTTLTVTFSNATVCTGFNGLSFALTYNEFSAYWLGGATSGGYVVEVLIRCTEFLSVPTWRGRLTCGTGGESGTVIDHFSYSILACDPLHAQATGVAFASPWDACCSGGTVQLDVTE